MFNALQEAKQAFQNKVNQKVSQITKPFRTYTVPQDGKVGLVSPVSQQAGKQFNTNPFWNQVQASPMPEGARPSPSPAAEKFWDSTNGAKMKHFNNPDDYARAVEQLRQINGLPAPSPTPMPTQQPRANMPRVLGAQSQGAANINPEVQAFIESTIFPVTRKHGIPDAVAAGQFAAEGRLQGLGAERNNFYNIAAYDHNPNNAYRYDSPEAGVEAYAQLLKRRYGPALEKQNVIEMLQMIEQLGYAGDPKTYRKRANNGFSSYADFIQSVPEYRYYANQQ